MEMIKIRRENERKGNRKTMEKIHETKNLLLEKIHKTDKSLARPKKTK